MGSVERTRRTSRARVALLTTVVAAATVSMAACGSSGDTATAPTTAAATAAASSTTTTAEEPTSSTTTPGAAAGAATLGHAGSNGSGTGPDGGATARNSDETTDADEVAPDVTWSLGATDYRGEDGLLVTYDCPPDGVVGSVWGSGVYTDDSSVCTAAVHAGLITEAGGGEVVIEIGPGLDAYEGSTANGVTSLAYGPWDGSFAFSDA